MKSKSVETDKKVTAMSLAEVRTFIELLAKENPDAESELNYTSSYTLLVAVVLSAQATDASVNKATDKLFQAASTPSEMVALGEEGVAKYINSIGLWRAKSRNVVALSAQLLEHYNGEVPGERKALEALPGVGRKTANVVLNIAFNQSTMAVDTHIFRLGNRTGLAIGKDVLAVEKALIRRIPKELLRDSHHWLILHGRYICKARKPECWRCPATAVCHYPNKNLAI
ncbi:endonuclease III [Commensalibacter communis]|uniref:endonuclease III n=1 Tax=Commensalibacter communis TaxID=2972786 RepID=UPI0022FF77E6|nr:endonuclease III [Commensalibacter communis]CAI3926769.1 Endonuclease III (Nth) (PDB:4UOB) [Commensalibacter communis]CAI3927904.1 Endonuclease III (Nth) (PDB:4UOB) [Commensalibacter communis]